uniref:Uncharacterized protein n=1 Tax=Saccharum spontaneum TaxID=62335 RepID=A0A678T699_SACSP|nr:hypothetical protein SS29K18_000013 [Saccharum spontaneum]
MESCHTAGDPNWQKIAHVPTKRKTYGCLARDDLNNVVQHPNSQRSMLTEYFSTNMYNPDARKEKGGQIGKLVYAHPAEGEQYYLCVLLNHVRGTTSFEHLRSQRGTTYVETDKSLDDYLTESAQFKMPCALRRQFATIIVF